MRRIPELDALRAFAAVVVLFFHLDPLRYFPGWSGVDLFFVLSGYLITSIILKNGDSSGFYPNFYARRSLRIWPIYYLTVLGLVIFNSFLTVPGSLTSIPWVLTFTQNISLYWGRQPPRAYPPLDHTWTLAIEEQFYLIWPALVIWAGRRRLVPLCLLTIAIALASRSEMNGLWPRLNERLLLARCDGFALGGLLALGLEQGGWLDRNRRKASAIFASTIGLALAYLAWGCWRDTPLGFIGLPTPSDPAGTIFLFGVIYAGIVGLVTVQTGARRLAPLRLGPIVYLGRISYGLYLYHYVVYWLIDGCQVGPHPGGIAQPWTTQTLKLAASLAAAVVSWHLIEQPILRAKDRFRYHEKPTGELPGAHRSDDGDEAR